MPSPAELLLERERLLREKEQLTAELRVMQLKVEKLQRQLWDRRSERLPATDPGQRVLFDEPPASAPARKQPARSEGSAATRSRSAA